MNPNRKRPPTIVHAVVYPVVTLIFWLMGWKTKGSLPHLPKFVLIFAPHTSYMDNYLLAPIQALYRFEGMWLAAEKLFKNPFLRAFLLFAGARPVDRSHSANLVERYITEFKRHDYYILGIAPEGTRHARDTWRSGFYHIAIGADVPIVCLSFDYKRKEVEIGCVVYPTGDIEADMEPITAFYAGKMGRHPERMTPVAVSIPADQARKAG
ncbi:MAG: 1-acyl-sn-glycerol-3-phosphate acyltransferase [Phototrophicaceae bacterium]